MGRTFPKLDTAGPIDRTSCSTCLILANLKLPHAEGEDADSGGKPETIKSDACGCFRVIFDFHGRSDEEEIKKPLNQILVA